MTHADSPALGLPLGGPLLGRPLPGSTHAYAANPDAPPLRAAAGGDARCSAPPRESTSACQPGAKQAC